MTRRLPRRARIPVARSQSQTHIPPYTHQTESNTWLPPLDLEHTLSSRFLDDGRLAGFDIAFALSAVLADSTYQQINDRYFDFSIY